jgi:hypothetical protein
MHINSGNRHKRRFLGVLVSIPLLALTLVAQQTASLMVSGQQGTAKVVQVQGHNYVDIEGLARLTNGSISFKGNQIVLNLPNVGPASSAAPQPPPGFSKDFLTAAVEAMTRVREWHAALRTAIERGVPLGTGWLDTYQAQAQDSLRLAAVAINTDSDKSAYPVLINEFNTMKSLNDKYVGMTKSMNYIDPNSLQSDPLDQKLLACGHSLSAMASARQFVDDGACP